MRGGNQTKITNNKIFTKQQTNLQFIKQLHEETKDVQKRQHLFHIEHKYIYMSVILKDTVPPIIEVAEFGYAAVAVYSLLYQSAYQDQRYDKKNYVKRKDCGGTTNWSHKGIANKLHMGKQKVLECIDLLLDNGFIQLEGFMSSSIGSKHRIYRVVHPNMLEIVREVMPIMPCLPSKSAKERSRGQLKSNRYQTEYQEGQIENDDAYPWDLDDRLNDTSY